MNFVLAFFFLLASFLSYELGNVLMGMCLALVSIGMSVIQIAHMLIGDSKDE